MALTRLVESRCPSCGPRLYFLTHLEDGDVRHEIPCIVDAEEMRGESHCQCGEIVLMAFEPIEQEYSYHEHPPMEAHRHFWIPGDGHDHRSSR